MLNESEYRSKYNNNNNNNNNNINNNNYNNNNNNHNIYNINKMVNVGAERDTIRNLIWRVTRVRGLFVKFKKLEGGEVENWN